MTEADRPVASGESPDGAGHAIWLAVFAAATACLQLMQPVPWDSDTAFHLAVARLIREHGILHSFPWTPFSWLSDHYADKELAFHLLLVPMAGLDLAVAGKLAGTLLGTALLFLTYRILVAERVRSAGLWTLLALVCSGAFAVRFALVRPHLLSIPLALLVLWAAARRRLVLLGLAALLYPFCYVAWHTALVLVGIMLAAQALGGRRPDWRAPLVVAAGLATALLLHPNFPNIVRFFWLVNYEILVQKSWGATAGFALGGEFQPFSALGLLRFVLLPAALATAAAVAAWRRRAADPLPLAFALAAVCWLALTLRTQRFLEYLVPFAAMAAALAFARLGRRRLAALVAAALLYTVAFGRTPVLNLRARTDMIPPALAAELRAVIPPGAQVFTCDWQLTGEMMLALPDRRFIVALDPVLFWQHSPELYRLWFDLVRRPPAQPAAIVRDRFGARHVLCESRPEWDRFLQILSRDPQAWLVLHRGPWLAFQLAPPLLDQRR